MSVCRNALWGIGGQQLILDSGKICLHTDQIKDCRTAVGINATRKQLFFAVFESASFAGAAAYLAARGVIDATLLDGGDSSCLSIGRGAQGIIPRTLVYPTRANATILGVRARGSKSTASLLNWTSSKL